MPREANRRSSTGAPLDGPVQPGSPLYRILQMVARAVVHGRLEEGRATQPDAAPQEEKPEGDPSSTG
jgi:hypothetical protein